MIRKLFLLALPLAALFAACGGDDSTNVDAAVPDSATKETGGCPSTCIPCSPPSSALTCKPGVAGKVCDFSAVHPPVCPSDHDGGTSTTWTCQPGDITADMCGCSTATYPTLKAGDDCPTGGQDSSVADTSTE
jgi:hypothetical protein